MFIYFLFTKIILFANMISEPRGSGLSEALCSEIPKRCPFCLSECSGTAVFKGTFFGFTSPLMVGEIMAYVQVLLLKVIIVIALNMISELPAASESLAVFSF